MTSFNLEVTAKQMPFLLRLLLLVVFITATERKENENQFSLFMLENDKDDKGGGAMIPSLRASRAGTELSRLYTFA